MNRNHDICYYAPSLESLFFLYACTDVIQCHVSIAAVLQMNQQVYQHALGPVVKLLQMTMYTEKHKYSKDASLFSKLKMFLQHIFIPNAM